MPTIRILHGANMYCSPALVPCLVTFEETFVEDDVVKDACATVGAALVVMPSAGPPPARSSCRLRYACRYVVRRLKCNQGPTVPTPYPIDVPPLGKTSKEIR